MGSLRAAIPFFETNLSVSVVAGCQNLADSGRGVWTLEALGIWQAWHVLMSCVSSLIEISHHQPSLQTEQFMNSRLLFFASSPGWFPGLVCLESTRCVWSGVDEMSLFVWLLKARQEEHWKHQAHCSARWRYSETAKCVCLCLCVYVWKKLLKDRFPGILHHTHTETHRHTHTQIYWQGNRIFWKKKKSYVIQNSRKQPHKIFFFYRTLMI